MWRDRVKHVARPLQRKYRGARAVECKGEPVARLQRFEHFERNGDRCHAGTQAGLARKVDAIYRNNRIQFLAGQWRSSLDAQAKVPAPLRAGKRTAVDRGGLQRSRQYGDGAASGLFPAVAGGGRERSGQQEGGRTKTQPPVSGNSVPGRSGSPSNDFSRLGHRAPSLGQNR
jgi:hypothetical protein